MDEDNNIRTEKKGDFDYITNDIIYLLRIEQDTKSHYIYIKHIERLFNLHSSGDDKDKKLCPMCNGKIKLCEYSKHISMCYKFCKEGSLLKLPEPGSTMKFKKFKNKLERPFIVYADTECTLEKVYGDKIKCINMLSILVVITLFVPMTVLKTKCGTQLIQIVLNKW